MKRNMDRALFGSVILLGLGLGINAEACSTDGWLGGSVNIPGNGAAGSPPTVSRYSQLCGLRITSQAHVQSNFASDARYRGRFYVLDGLTGSGTIDIFEAYSDEAATSALFKVSFNGSQVTFDATDAGGGSASIATANGWNLIEFDWDSGANLFSYWVNANANLVGATGSVAAGAGSVEAVRLGAPNGFSTQTGHVTFDAFESHRTTPIGELLVGDANGSGTVSGLDLVVIQNEILQINLAQGQPDCNKNGAVSGIDLVCVQNIILGN